MSPESETFVWDTLATMQRGLARIGHFENVHPRYYQRVEKHREGCEPECVRAGGRCAYDAVVQADG